MKVLHVNSSDRGGGAEKLAYDVHSRLNERSGISSELIVGTKHRSDSTVSEIPFHRGERIVSKGIERILSLEGFAAPSSREIVDLAGDVDIVHLHNVHGSYFHLPMIRELPADLPIVWTLHDMWPMTGNCVYSHGCRRYQNSCGLCPQIDDYPRLTLDTTRMLLAKKTRLINDTDVHFVGPSRWILEKLSGSRINPAGTHHIPNGVDTTHFSPSDKSPAREWLGLEQDDTVVLFLASSLNSARKGGDLLLDALDLLSDSLKLLVVGSGDFPVRDIGDDIEVIETGFVEYRDLPETYAAADLFVTPSIAENFPLVVLEAMACGTPVVGFPTGGIPEQIDPSCGYLCDGVSSFQLARTIRRALSNQPPLSELGSRARDRVESSFDLDNCVSNYMELYRSLLT